MQNKKQKIITIILCFIMVLFGLGLWAQKSLLVVPITTALQIDRSAYSVADTMRYIATAIVNFFFGYLISKFGAKKLILAGFACLIGSALCYAFSNGLLLLYVGGFLLGIGFSWTSTAVVAYVVNKVCKEKKGTIMGLILAANGLGGCIATLIITPFISGDDVFGYRKFFYLMATIFFAVFLLILFLFREPKNGSSEDTNEKTKIEWQGIEWNIAKKKTYFYVVCFCVFASGMVLQGISGIYAARMKDVGMAQNVISVMAILASVFLALSKFLNGFMCDKKGLRFTATVDCISSVFVMIVLLFISNSTFGIILGVCYTIFSAIALPLETVIVPMYAKELFGEKSFSKILGIFVSINQIGYAVSSPIINLCYDLTNSYDIALVVCMIIMIVVVICLQYVFSMANKEKRLLKDIAK